MWASIKGFFQRHRRKLIVGGVVVVGVYVATRYAKWHITEWRHQQEREFMEQARKLHHFESNQRTCSITLYSLLPSLRDTLLEKLNSEEITSKLREKPDNKIELWRKLKVLSFARTITAVYSSCLLLVFLRVQLNIIGGYMYLDSLQTNEGERSNGRGILVAENIQKKYLALVKYLMSEGLDEMIVAIKKATEAILDELSLKEKFTPSELQRLINHIRQSFEFSQHAYPSTKPLNGERSSFATSRPFCKFMLPKDIQGLDEAGDERDDKFAHLVEETLDILESEDCNAVLQSCLDVAFNHVINNIGAFFVPDNMELGAVGGSALEVSISLPLAKIIPIINGQIHHMFSDVDSSYIQDLFKVRCSGDFAANIYEAFSTEVD